jgi:protocatechuate 3,4-dioxygenase alpha subunit
VTAGPTPSQTIGPFFSVALPAPDEARLVEPGAPGAITLEGTVRDGAGEPVDDALLEIWQADPTGRFGPDAALRGFGRCLTDGAGRYAFVTVRPGRVPDPTGALQAPHIDVSVFARGLLDRLVTRIYFPDEEEANAVDAVLASLPEQGRSSLVAAAVDGGFRFDVHLQGERETTFFDL